MLANRPPSRTLREADPDATGAHILYLCYFGLREPLVQTQVLPYLRELRRGGLRLSLLTFEPETRSRWTAEERQAWEKRLAADGIRWLMLPYHKRPAVPATLYDVCAGVWLAARYSRREGVQFLHARAHVPGIIGALCKCLVGGRLVFDIRGFLPEEYVDAGTWPKNGWLFRLAKRAERRLLRAADAFVVLTEQARDILFPGCGDTDGADAEGRPVEIVPCCADKDRFDRCNASRSQVRAELGVENRTVLIYIGALGGSYLTAEMADLMRVAHSRDPSTFFLVLTQSDPELIAASLRSRGIRHQDVLIRSVLPAEVPRYLKAADLGLLFTRPGYSKLSCSPTKLAEYLISGLPVLSNRGIGDVDELLTRSRTGVLVQELNREGYWRALGDADALRAEPGTAERCRKCAYEEFDLARVGGVRYRRLYRRLGADSLPCEAEPVLSRGGDSP